LTTLRHIDLRGDAAEFDVLSGTPFLITCTGTRDVVFARSTFGSGSRSNTDEFHVVGGTPFS
jgi:hypothetical protein